MELSDKHLAEVVRLFYETNTSSRVIKTMRRRHPELEALNRMRVHRIIQKFEACGSIADGRRNNNGRPRSARSGENIDCVRKVIEDTPQRSIRRLMADIGNVTSKMSVHRMLKYDLKLTPYKISIMQHLKETDISSRMEFAAWMKSQPNNFADTIWFSDEAHFYLNNAVNKQNCRFWGSEKPNFYLEKPLHGEKVTAWAAMSATGIIGPFFIEDHEGHVTTVNSERYIQLLKRKFLPALRRKDIDLELAWFQQDGAGPHTAAAVMQWLEATFDTRFISFRSPNVWPPHSPDLSPLDFYLWGYLKDKVYTPAPETTDDLKKAIVREMRKITPETCRAVISNFRRRLELVVQQNGRHLEHVM